MKNIISYFIKYPISADVLVLLILVFGLLGVMSTRSTFFPETETELISVRTIFPGASPEEVEEGVIRKIEENLSGLTGVDRITSISQENGGSVVVEIKDGYDIDEILSDVKNAVDQINSFPSGLEPPVIAKQEFLTNAINFAISGDTDLKTLKTFARRIEADLLASDNISKVELSGFPDEEIAVSVRENDLRRFNLTFDQVVRAVQVANIEISGGTVKGDSEELLIRSRNKSYNAQGLEDLVVSTAPDGRKVLLTEVADIEDRWSEVANSVQINGKPGIFINVSNTTDENLLTISGEVKEYISNFNQENSIITATIVNDGAVTLQQRIDLLTSNGMLGFILVLVILAMFLQIRLAFWVALAIPISFMGMAMLAGIFGVSINMLSLFGMILVIGILVDDGIVISENIFRHYEMGKGRFEAALDGTMEVLPAVTGAILTTIAAFGSFLFVSGITGQFFGEMALVVILTLFFSLLEGAFVLPAHVAHSKALSPKKDKKASSDEELEPGGLFSSIGQAIANGFDRLQHALWDLMEWMKMKLYAPSLEFFMRHTILGLFIPTGILIICISLISGGFVQTTFFPSIEADFVTATIKFPAGTPEAITQKGLDQMEAAVWKVNEMYKAERPDGKDVITIVSKNLGAGGGGVRGVVDASSLASSGSNAGSLLINLLDSESRDIRALELAEAFRKETGVIEGADVVNFSISGPFGDAVSVSMRSNNLSELSLAVNELKDQMGEMADLRNIQDNNQIGLREININLKEKAYLLGLTPQFIMFQIRQGFFGAEVQRLQRGKDEVKVWVRYTKEDRSSIGKLENMRIRTADGSSYPLKELVDLDYSRGIIAISHLDGDREIRVTADLASVDVSGTEVNNQIAEELIPPILAKYPSVRFSLEGQVRSSAETQQSSQRVMPFAFLLILTIIIITFRSWSQTIAVGLTLPFGLIGVILGHLLLGKPISLLSLLGVFALIGVMVNDALVLVNAFNNLIKEGKPFKESIIEAALSRFRPIVLTSLTTIAGLLPLIFEKSFQAQLLIPVAISIAFGLMVATFNILINLPILLVMFNKYKLFLIWLWKGERWEPAMVEPAREDRKNQFWLWAFSSIGFVAFIVLLSRIPAIFS
ncbi:MAG: efflux RND transporter permease subunit [Bacteroidia bacterium]